MIAVQELGALALIIAGNEAQKHKYLTKLSSGQMIGAYALTEAGSGSDAAGSMRTRAERRGDDYVLNGSKVWITNGSVADVVAVFAVTDPAKGPAGISAFMVEKSFPGFKVGKLEKKMGIRGSPTCELIFEDCIVPAENLLGPEGTGFKTAMRVLDKSRPGIAAQAVGIAAGALDYATNYACERIAFGKPIAQQQGIQFIACRYAGRTRIRALAVVRSRSQVRYRSARPYVVGRAMQTQSGRYGDEGHDRRRADTRRLRLLDRVSGRAHDARCEDHADL